MCLGYMRVDPHNHAILFVLRDMPFKRKTKNKRNLDLKLEVKTPFGKGTFGAPKKIWANLLSIKTTKGLVCVYGGVGEE